MISFIDLEPPQTTASLILQPLGPCLKLLVAKITTRLRLKKYSRLNKNSLRLHLYKTLLHPPPPYIRTMSSPCALLNPLRQRLAFRQAHALQLRTFQVSRSYAQDSKASEEGSGIQKQADKNARPVILEHAPPAQETEEVKKHNQEFEKRPDRLVWFDLGLVPGL